MTTSVSVGNVQFKTPRQLKIKREYGKYLAAVLTPNRTRGWWLIAPRLASSQAEGSAYSLLTPNLSAAVIG